MYIILIVPLSKHLLNIMFVSRQGFKQYVVLVDPSKHLRLTDPVEVVNLVLHTLTVC